MRSSEDDSPSSSTTRRNILTSGESDGGLEEDNDDLREDEGRSDAEPKAGSEGSWEGVEGDCSSERASPSEGAHSSDPGAFAIAPSEALPTLEMALSPSSPDTV